MKMLKFEPRLNQHKAKHFVGDKKGFTIIEVVLVLAIAGLIFLMVFIALPALQRNQRDTQRKNDLSRALTAVQNYQSNNKGSMPWNLFNTTLYNNYLNTGGDTFKDPDGENYIFYGDLSIGNLPNSRKSADGKTLICVFKSGKCDGERTVSAGGDNKVALSMVLEGGGVYCVNN